jgi:hypothetical protein
VVNEPSLRPFQSYPELCWTVQLFAVLAGDENGAAKVQPVASARSAAAAVSITVVEKCIVSKKIRSNENERMDDLENQMNDEV